MFRVSGPIQITHTEFYYYLNESYLIPSALLTNDIRILSSISEKATIEML